MSNLYTGRREDDLWKACIADYRFYRSSLLNFRPGTIDPIGTSTYNEVFRGAVPQMQQSKVCGVPAVAVELDTDGFAFPDGFDTVLGEDTAFTVEYLGWPQDRGSGVYLALLGQNTAADPYVGLADNNLITINFGAGAQTSDPLTWYWKDAPLHFVVTREADADPDFTLYCNGTTVLWNGGNAVIAAGNDGFTDALGAVFNHADNQAVVHPMYGHHLMLRVYNEHLLQSEVRYLYKRAQRLLPHDLLHIPLWENPA